MREHRPNKWEILKITHKKETWYRVFGSWTGGYLDGDSWRLSSGLEEITEEGEYYLMKNHSGSVYKCHKEMRGVAGGSNYAVLSGIIDQGKEQGIKVELIGVDEFKKEQG